MLLFEIIVCGLGGSYKLQMENIGEVCALGKMKHKYVVMTSLNE